MFGSIERLDSDSRQKETADHSTAPVSTGQEGTADHSAAPASTGPERVTEHIMAGVYAGPERMTDHIMGSVYAGPERVTDHIMGSVYAGPERVTDHIMGSVYAGPERVTEHRMGAVRAGLDRLIHAVRKKLKPTDGKPKGAVYPNNHRAESKPTHEANRAAAGSFPFIDLTPDAAVQKLDGPEGMLFLYKKTGKPIRLTNPKATIGRGYGCSLVIDDIGVSSPHVILTFNRGSWYIRDLDSARGTKLNGVPLRPGRNYLLRPGDKIYFAGNEEEAFVAVLNHDS